MTLDDVPRGMLAIPVKTLGHFEAELSYPSDNLTDHFVPLDVEMRKAILMPLLKTVRHNLCFGDVEKVGEMTDKCTRRAVTSIFRKAVVWSKAPTNLARQFKQDASGLFIPCIKYPNCGHATCGTSPTCLGCGAKLMTVHQVPNGKLKAPLLSLRHFKLAFREKNYPLSAEDLDLIVFSTQAPLNEADYSSDEDVNM
jgi:hypothetical protein